MQCCQRGRRFRVFIRIKHDGFTAFFDRNRHNFSLKMSGFNGRCRFHLAGQRKLILCLTSDVVLFSDIFCRHTHVVLIEDIGQTVMDEQIFHFKRAHFLPIS
ncbi:Uncharacterised protein [Vibrio cholerae]|nr:Uncharacterised protein [Vibrio cholerae]